MQTIETFNAEKELSQITAQSGIPPLQILRKNLSDILSRGGIDGAFQTVALAFSKDVIDIDSCHSLLHLVGHYAYAR